MGSDRNTSPYSPDFYREIEEEFENMTEKSFEDQHEEILKEMKQRGIIDE